MTIRLATLILALALAACARPLPVATGPVRQLNVGKWVPGMGDLAVPPERPARSGA